MATTAAAAAAAAFAGGAKPRRRPVLHSRIAAGGRRRSVVVRCDAGVEAEPQAQAAVDAASRAALEQLENSSNRYMRARSSVGVIGLSVHTAPVEMREKLAVPEELWPRTILELTDLDHIHEAAVLSTCNRMEIYVVALSWNVGIREVLGWMSEKSGIPASELRKHIFMLRDGDAKRHLFEVAAGLDSLVLGEGQILAQVRQVVTSGENSGALGKYFNRMFKAAITAGKRVRSETNISSGAVSVSSAAVELALKKLPKSQCHSARMLLIGAGKMGKLVIKHLMAKGCKQVVVVNRSVDRVDAIREEMKEIEIVYRPLTEMYEAAADADVVFTSTASETPLFMKEHVEALPPVSEAIGGARLFIDISVPRNVGSCVSDLGYARVYNVDDLKEVVEANKEDRLRKATEARTVISQELKKFEAWSDSRQAFPTIKKLRSYADRIRVSEFEKCLQKIGGHALTKKERKSIEALSTGIVNKLLHGPMQHLRCDGSDSCTPDEISENVHALHRMFDLDTEEDDIEQIIKAKVKKAQS